MPVPVPESVPVPEPVSLPVPVPVQVASVQTPDTQDAPQGLASGLVHMVMLEAFA
jgi:hypothetical protein